MRGTRPRLRLLLALPRSCRAHGGGARAARHRGAGSLSVQTGPSYPTHAETDRLLLRQFRQADLDAYTALLSDPEVAPRFGFETPFTRNDAWRHMAMLMGHWTLLGYGRFAVELKATGAFIGRVGLWFPEGWPEIECGWAIHPHHWGNGYATEAAAETLRLGFATLGVTHLISLIRPDNPRSARVAEKLGGSIERAWNDFQGREALVYGYPAPPAER